MKTVSLKKNKKTFLEIESVLNTHPQTFMFEVSTLPSSSVNVIETAENEFGEWYSHNHLLTGDDATRIVKLLNQ